MKPYTQNFILDIDEEKYIINDQKLMNDHQMRINESLIPKREFYQPKPGRKNNHCDLCRVPYNDYLEHS